ncbi:MAG: hypothetical protein LC708_01960, partial [Actinobacteria bacterium]|nr:hypothetical protein [Actinomycetota bacterium]
IDTLTDDIYGDLATRAGSTCGALIGTTLAPGASSAPCTFTGPFNGNGGDSQTDVVTVVGHDDQGRVVTDDDDATVILTPGPVPQILVDKTADPLSLPAPGGTFTFTVVVINPGSVAVTIDTLTDDIYGDLATRAGSTCGALIGTTLAPGASSAPCTFTGPFNGDPGDSQTDVVTVVGHDDQGTSVTDDDDATVILTPGPLPQIAVDKTADPLSLPAPGGTFTFTVVVTNPGPVDVTIDSLTDDIYGDLATRAGSTCGALIGTTLAPGASSAPCSFTGPFNGDPGDSQTDVVTVVGHDDQGTSVTDDDDATVILTPGPAPQILVDKTADPLSQPAPGG